MAEQDGNPEPRLPGTEKPEPEDDFLAIHAAPERRSWTPWIVATAVIIAVVIALVFLSGRGGPAVPSGPGLAPPAPYAAYLPITQVVISGATSFSGAQVTYIDGQIANTGNEVITGISVQVGFHGFTNEFVKRETMPLALIRTRQPYVDTQPVSAAPLKPGDHREFRLIFDSIPEDWNQQLPELRIIRTVGR